MMKTTSIVILIVVLLLSSLPSLATGYNNQCTSVEEVNQGTSSAYNVTFQEQNLSSGVSWGVDVNSSSFYSQASQISVHLANGSYNYSIVIENVSFRPVYAQGSFRVSGHPLEIPVKFEQVTYPVIFNENGLPLNSTWTVVAGGMNQSRETGSGGAGDYTIFNMINGSYKWNAAPSGAYVPLPQNGSFTVRGNISVINLHFEQAYSQVVFEDVGLPYNVSWYVNFNGSVKYSNASIIVFVALYGNYSYSVGSNDTHYHSFTGLRHISVNNLDVFINVYFWSENYTVAFNEAGLPTGTEWSLDVGAQIYNSTNSTVVTFLPNGTYYYTLSVVDPAYVPSNRTGSFTVDGHGLSINLIFEPLTYQVIFSRSGPSDVKWEIMLGGDNVSTNSSIITFREVYGEYNFTVSIFNQDYSPSPESGTVYVTVNTSITVVFIPTTFRQIFIEKGLPENFTWTVRLGNATVVSSNESVTFNEMNGTYSFAVSAKNYTVFPSSGTITVSGKSEALNVRFVSYVYISFSVSGIPKGSEWSVTIDGRQFNSSSQILSIFVPNGTYYYIPISTGNFTYSVLLPPGYSLTSENSFNATASMMVSLVGQPTGGGTGPFNSLGEYLIVIVALVGAALIIMAASLIIKKKGWK